MEYTTLSNGIKIPMTGYGVFQIEADKTKDCVIEAINKGYRLIDTAQAYGNEAEVGAAIAESNIAREELFVTTKVWISNYGYEKTIASINESLEKLGLDYIDLVLLHQPFSDYYGSWRALETLYNDGKIKAIGVSNFYPDRLVDLCLYANIKPMINQVEVNPIHPQLEAQPWMEKYGVVMQAWAPFGEGKNNMFDNPVLTNIACKYNVSTAQIMLRWLFERNIVSLAKTVTSTRMKQNQDIYNFSLAQEDKDQIATLAENNSLFFNHQTPEAAEYLASFSI